LFEPAVVAGIKGQVGAEFSQTRSAVSIGVLSDYAIHEQLVSGEVRRVLIGYDIKGEEIYALYPHRHHLSAKVRVFIDYLLATLGNGECTRTRTLDPLLKRKWGHPLTPEI